MSLNNNVNLAKKIEKIKMKGTAEYIFNRKKMSTTYNGDYFALDGKGSVFCMDSYCFGVGFGLDGEILSSDLETIENWGKNNSSHVHFELTSYTNQQSLKVLKERGYTLDQFLSVWVLNLDEWQPRIDNLLSNNVTITKVTSDESYDWARTVALGFSSDGTTSEDSIESVRGFLNLSNSVGVLLKEHNECVAGGFLAIDDQIGEMFLTSTIHSHRGKRYQNYLIEERINYAKSKGCTHLTVTTKPNNTSARNMERNGFKLAYNKVIMKSPKLQVR